MALRTPAFNDAKTYKFGWLRYLAETGDLQEGVIAAGDMKVTPAGAGGQRVDIAAGAAYVKGDSGIAATGLSQGLFLIVNDAAVASAVTLNASDPTNPRIDQICLRLRDSTDLATGADDATFLVVSGTATAGATLDNRNGAAALPNDYLRLADVLVPAASSAVTAANVRDRRPWARGFNWSTIRSGVADYSTASTTVGLIDSTNLYPRVECSGAPLEILLSGTERNNGTQENLWHVWQDGAGVSFVVRRGSPAASFASPIHWTRVLTPTAGSHLIGPAWAVAAASTAILHASGTSEANVQLSIRERVQQAANNT